MMTDYESSDARSRVQAALEGERARIVRLCAHLSGEPAVAEDLAQETLIEAWRHLDHLRDVNAYQAWLTGIARNICLRWRRRRHRERNRELRVIQGTHVTAGELGDTLAADVDLEVANHHAAAIQHPAGAVTARSDDL